MIEFFSTLVRLFKAIVGAWRRDPQFRTLVGLVFFTLLSGTIFYTLEEGWSIVDAFYFSVTTLTTVGLGDLSPTTTLGKLFTVIYIFAGLSLVLGFIDTVSKGDLQKPHEGTGQRRRPRGGAWQLGWRTSENTHL
jgi:voltage-gated potassium channel